MDSQPHPDTPEPLTPAPRTPRTLAEYLAGPPPRSQRSLAKVVHVHQSMISMLTRGERAARGTLATKLHKVTGVPLAVLIVATKRRRRPPKKKPPRAARQHRRRSTP
jgi:hypothetical protein